jgi:hypothetical protein
LAQVFLFGFSLIIFFRFSWFFNFFIHPCKIYGVSKMHGSNSRLPIKETTKKDI